MSANTGKVIPPSIHSGLEKNKYSVVLVVAILQVVYSFFMYTLKDSGTYLVPAEEFCEDKVYFSGNPPICSRPDMASFQIAVIIPIFFCGLVGFWAWHVSASPHYKLPQTVEGRLFGYLPEAKWLGVFNFSFQLWDFFISLMIPEHATPLMLTHHVLAGFGGYFSMEHQYLHYYGVYFLGCSEFSSMFLCFVDFSRYFPPQEGTLYYTFVEICKVCFALTFFWYRVVNWTRVSLMFWKDCMASLKSGSHDNYRPGKRYCMYYFLFINVALTLMQYYWLSMIISEAIKALDA